MHYVETGAGHPVVFLHGNPASSYLWRNVIPYVSPVARCVAPDLIGMGHSDKPDIDYRFADHARYLEGLLERLGLRNSVLVVHDWGSILGFDYAARHERNLRGLVFLEALLKPYETWNDFPAALRHIPGVPPAGRRLPTDRRTERLHRTTPAGEHAAQLTPGEMDCYRLPFRDPPSRKVIWRLATELPIEGKPADVARAVAGYSRWLQKTSLPKLLIYAEPGAITTAPDVEWCRDRLKNLTAVSVGPGIHFHQEDNPEGVGRAIADWLRQPRDAGRFPKSEYQAMTFNESTPPIAGGAGLSPAVIASLIDFQAAQSGAGEKVLVRLTRGRGRFSRDKRYIAPLDADVPPRRYAGRVPGGRLGDACHRPERVAGPPVAAGPADGPAAGAGRAWRPTAETKAVWVFGDGSTISAAGPALGHLVPLEDGSVLFMICCSQTITGGTGRFAGAAGLKTTLGSSHVPPGVDLFGPGDAQFEAITVDTFRVMTAGGGPRQ